MKNMTLTFRISVLVILLLVSLLVVSVSLVLSIRTVTATLSSDNSYRQYNVNLLAAWRTYETAYAITADIGNRFTARQVELPELQQSYSVSLEALNSLSLSANALDESMLAQWQRQQGAGGAAGIEGELADFAADFSLLSEAFAALNTSWEEKAGFAARKKTEKDMAAALEGMDARVQSINKLYQQFTQQRADQTIASQRARMTRTIVITMVVMIIATLFSVFLLRKMRRDLAQIVAETGYLADGDLTRSFSVSDRQNEINDVKRSVLTMQQKLHAVFRSVMDLSQQLRTSTSQLVSDGQERMSGAELQREKMAGITAAFEEIERLSEQVGDNATATIAQADEASALTEQGEAVVNGAVATITSLAGQIEDAVDVIAKLDAQAENIQNILSVIKGIADQTNLLALNAAIEAARAGEQGRGFAVVADEVRTLAMRTQQSTEEIESTLAALTSGTGQAVNSIQASQKASANSVASINEAGDIITQISTAVNAIRNMTEQTATSAREQIGTVKAASHTVTDVASVAKNNAEQARASRDITGNLTQVSEQIVHSVQDFRLKD